MKETCDSSSPASAGRIVSSSSRPQTGVPASIRSRSSSLGSAASRPSSAPALEGLDAEVVVEDPLAWAELQVAAVRLELDLALGGEPRAQQRRAHGLGEVGLGDQEERLGPLAHDPQRRDDPALRRQQQRRPGLAGLERDDLVRDHPLEKVGRLGPRDGDVAAVEAVQRSGRGLHAFSVGTRVHSNGGESRREPRRYSSRPTSPSPSYETALGPFRRCGGRFHRIAGDGVGYHRARPPLDARRRLHDDVHAAARHHGRERRAAEHPARPAREPDRSAMGGRRLRADPRSADPDRGRARRPLRPPAALRHRRGRLHPLVAALRPRLEHRRARHRPRRAGRRRCGALRHGAGVDRGGVPADRTSVARSRSGARRSASPWRRGR